jgi:hypothetical protein
VRDPPSTLSWWWAVDTAIAGSHIGKTFGTFHARRPLLKATAEFSDLLVQTHVPAIFESVVIAGTDYAF